MTSPEPQHAEAVVAPTEEAQTASPALLPGEGREAQRGATQIASPEPLPATDHRTPTRELTGPTGPFFFLSPAQLRVDPIHVP